MMRRSEEGIAGIVKNHLDDLQEKIMHFYGEVPRVNELYFQNYNREVRVLKKYDPVASQEYASWLEDFKTRNKL